MAEWVFTVTEVAEFLKRIINAEDMMKTWNDLGVSVCRTESGGPVELATASEVFKEAQEKITPEMLEKLKDKKISL